MVTVDQNMTITPTSIERDQPAFVFGPNYELHRYSNDDEREGTKVDSYKGDPMNVPYPKVIDYEKVDQSYTKLIGENVVVELADLTPGDTHAVLVEDSENAGAKVASKVAANGGYTKLLVAGKDYVDSSDSSGYDGIRKPLKAGDNLVVFYKDTAGNNHSFLTEIMWDRDEEGAEYDAEGHNIDSDSSYEGAAGTLITIVDAIPDANLDKSSVNVSLVAVLQNIEFERKNWRAYEDGSTNPGYQWEQALIEDDPVYGTYRGIKINRLNAFVTANYFDEPVWCTVLFADLFVTYRELNTAYADSLHNISTGASGVYNMLGTVDPDNPLAMGVYMAALNAATDDGDETPPVYFMAVPSDDENGYNTVLNKATTTDRVYALAPTTRDKTILENVRNHVVKMSSKEEKLWRIVAGSVDIPRTVNRLEDLMDVHGDEFYAIPVSDLGPDPDAVGAKFNKLRVVKSLLDISGNPDVQLRSTLKVGDFVRFNYHKSAWKAEADIFYIYRITKIVNNFTVEVECVEDGMGKDVSTQHLEKLVDSYKPAKVEFYHEYTNAELAGVIASISRWCASRRMLNVFPSIFEFNGVEMRGEFAACAIAGLISGTEPQQPITNVTVRGIDNIPLTYQTFDKYQLDEMAAGGTFIIMQDLPNDRVYVRHQITTAYPDGNLNTAELSITKNVDNISYAFAEVFRPYYGRFNITPKLLATFNSLASSLIHQLASSDSIYGPQLIAEQTEILYIRQNELMKDHVDIGIRLGVPYPCNNIDIVLTV